MTSRGKFERLANAVLSKSDARYAALIALGINAQDETIRGPCDAFCRIPGSDPPHFVSVQHTTTDRRSLRHKWLNESGDELGDLIKSGRSAQELRARFSNAHFSVVLSTNQRLPSDTLVIDVNEKADELDISVDIWEQSRYVRFLDTNRDGQYLRKTYLGIEAEMLSADLLAALGKESLALYRRRHWSDPQIWVHRELDDRIRRSFGQSRLRVGLLIGESGLGKSVAAYQFLEKHMNLGGYGLFIPEAMVQASISLLGAIRRTLQELHPSLLAQDISQISEIIPNDSQFVVVIDDVNHTNNPMKLINDLVGWAESPYLLVIPVWPRFWLQLQRFEHKNGVGMIAVDRLLAEEALDAVKTVVSKAGIEISRIETHNAAQKLGYDPLLIGVFGDLLKGARPDELPALAEDTISKAITEWIGEAVSTSGAGFFEHQYRDALRSLASQMLKRKRLNPKWEDVESWLQNSSSHSAALKELCGHGVLCYVSSDGAFRFRHDRFLEYLFVDSMVQFFEEPSENTDVLYEPFYAEWIGQALIEAPQENDVLDLIRDELPLALVAAIRFMGVPTTEYDRGIVRKVKEWVGIHAGKHSSTMPESIRGAVAISFMLTDSPAVLDIVDTTFGLEKYWFGDFARLRNGDPQGAMTYYSIFGLWGGDEAHFLLELVRHASLRHRESLTEGLKQLLAFPDTKQKRSGAAILAGFLAYTELEGALSTWWARVDDKVKYLAEAVWASLRCAANLEESKLLHSLLAYWNDLPDLEESHRLARQMKIADDLGLVLSVEPSEQIVRFLISKSTQYPSLREPIAQICGSIDLPDSIEFAVRAGDTNQDEMRSINLWQSPFRSKLSSPSVARLRQLWSMPENSDADRKLAFRLWLQNVDRDQEDVLSIVSTVTPIAPFFNSALWERAKLGDQGCIPQLLSVLKSDARFFCVASHFWSEKISAIAEEYLRSFETNIPRDFSGGLLDDHFYLAELLRDVPAEAADHLLLKHWSHLRYSRLFIQAALYVGTPKCQELVREAINEYPDDVEPLEHVGDFFRVLGFDGGLSIETSEPSIALQRIKNLEAYLHRVDEMTQRSFAAVCYRLGREGVEWCNKHFSESITERCRQRYYPTDEDLIQTLDRSSPNLWTVWLDGFKKRNDKRNPLDSVEKWLLKEPTYQKYEVATKCIEEIGNREDLRRLDVQLAYPVCQRMAGDLKASVTFAVRRRTLE